MTDEKLKKKFRNIPTEKFYSIRNAMGISGLTALLASIFNTVPIVDYSLVALFILNYSSFLTMKNYRAIDFSKSYIDLEDEYKLFLNNYRDLMNSLDINSLASLCASFYYLYKHGYLTIDDSINPRSEDYFEGRKYQLVNIFNGCGVCRHKSNSLKDILNYCGYPTGSIPIYARTYEEYTEEDIANMRAYFLKLFEEVGVDDKLKGLAADAFLNLEVVYHQYDLENQQNSEDYSEEKKRLAISAGNHLAVITTNGAERIVYDPTDNCFYQFKDKKSCDLINEYGMRMEYRLMFVESSNTPSEEKILYRNLKLNPMSLVGLRSIQEEAECRLKDNLDIVDKFKKDNLPLMQSLRDKAYKLVI